MSRQQPYGMRGYAQPRPGMRPMRPMPGRPMPPAPQPGRRPPPSTMSPAHGQPMMRTTRPPMPAPMPSRVVGQPQPLQPIGGNRAPMLRPNHGQMPRTNPPTRSPAPTFRPHPQTSIPAPAPRPMPGQGVTRGVTRGPQPVGSHRRQLQHQRPAAASQQQQQQQQQAPPQHSSYAAPVKSLKRSSTVAWCPSSRPEHSALLASGTTDAGTIDANWSSHYHLEILSTSFAEPSPEMRSVGRIEVPQSFSSIAWGKVGMAEGKHAAGIIAGGLSDGSIGLWNPFEIAGNKPHSLGHCNSHNAAVSGLEFHPSKHNLLASAGADGDVFIWDLTNTSKPSLSKPHKATKAHAMGVTAIAWNKAVPFILASSSEQGVTNIWDLRYKRAILNMKSPGQYRLATTGLCWHPTESVQIAVSYKGPVVEIWDLRKKGFPTVKIDNTNMAMHPGSVETMAWCPHEPRVLLTSGDDRRGVCWDAKDGSYLCDLALGGPLNELQWHPSRPSILSTCSYDGDLTVHTCHDFGPLAPSWLKRPRGVSFGFGGRLLSFGAADAPSKDGKAATPPGPGQVKGTTSVKVQRTVTEPEFVKHAKALVHEVRSFPPREFCEKRASESSCAAEKETWRLMSALFEQGGARRDRLLRELGFDPPAPAAAPALAPAAAAAAQPSAQPAAAPPSDEALMNADDFWNTQAEDEAKDGAEAEEKDKKDGGGDAADADAADADADAKKQGEPAEPPADAAAKPPPRAENATDRKVRQALVVGDYAKAAEVCVACGRMADAVLIAQCGDPGLWQRIVEKHFDAHPLAWAKKSLWPIVTKDYNKLVASADLANWRESLAMLLAYASEREEFPSLVDALAARLEAGGDPHAATLCYMVSGNVELAVERWLKEGAAEAQAQAADNKGNGEGASAVALQAAIEKLHFFSVATGLDGPPSMAIARKYCEFAGLLAAQGETADALFYLRQAIPRPNPSDTETISLLKRLEEALQGEVQAQAQAQAQAHAQAGVQANMNPAAGLGGRPLLKPRVNPAGGAMGVRSPSSNNRFGNRRAPPGGPGFASRGAGPPSRFTPPRNNPPPAPVGGVGGGVGGPPPPVPGPRPAPRGGPGLLRRAPMPMSGRPAPGPPPAGVGGGGPPAPGPRPSAPMGGVRPRAPMGGARPSAPAMGGRPQPPGPGPRPMLRGAMPAPKPNPVMPAPRVGARPLPRGGIPPPRGSGANPPPRGGPPPSQPGGGRAPPPGPSYTPLRGAQPPPSGGPRVGAGMPPPGPGAPRGGMAPPPANRFGAGAGPARGGPGAAPMPRPRGAMPPSMMPAPRMGVPATRMNPSLAPAPMATHAPPPAMPNPNPPMRGMGMGMGMGGMPQMGGAPEAKAPPPAGLGKKTGPRYSDLPDLPTKAGEGPASADVLSTCTEAVTQALAGTITQLKNSGQLNQREAKRLADVERRLDGLYQKLDVQNPERLSTDAAENLTNLCAALTSPQGPNVNLAKKIHMKLVTEDKKRENLKWLTGVKQLLMLIK